MSPRFYPADAAVPDTFQTAEFVMRPLRVSDVELDYAAVMDSKDMLRRWSASSWPVDDFALEGNRRDLEWHEREHLERKAFTYTVMAADRAECVGCVYIDPLAWLLRWGKASEAERTALGDDEAVVCFWARQSRLADGLERRLFDAIRDWLARPEWAFSRVVYRTSETDTRQIELFTGAGLRCVYVAQPADHASRYVVYG